MYEITPNAIVWRDEFNKYIQKWGEDVYEDVALIYNFDKIEPKLLNNKEFLIDSIRVNPQLYDFLCEEKIFENDRDLKHAYWHSMVSIVGAHYVNIQDQELYDNKNLAFVAIEGNAIAPVVNFCSERLLDDEQVMYACGMKNTEALCKASTRLREDPNFMLKITKECTLALVHIGPELLADMGENDPLDYLQKLVESDRLKNELANKPSKADLLVASIDEDAPPPQKQSRSTRQKI